MFTVARSNRYLVKPCSWTSTIAEGSRQEGFEEKETSAFWQIRISCGFAVTVSQS